MKIAEIEMLPCPFCGSEPARFKLNIIGCSKCRVYTVKNDRIFQSIYTWNNRYNEYDGIKNIEDFEKISMNRDYEYYRLKYNYETYRHKVKDIFNHLIRVCEGGVCLNTSVTEPLTGKAICDYCITALNDLYKVPARGY